MKTIHTDGIPAEQIDALDEFAATGVGPEMRDLLQSVIDCVRAGDDLAAVSPLTVLRPGQAAERLGMSRTHLYKLLDQGEIVSHRVGRDRRILLRDLIEFRLLAARAGADVVGAAPAGLGRSVAGPAAGRGGRRGGRRWFPNFRRRCAWCRSDRRGRW